MVIPLEIETHSFWTKTYDEAKNEIALRVELELINKKRNETELRNAIYKQRSAKYYNQRVRKQEFEVGSLVLRKCFLATREANFESLEPIWKESIEDTKGRPLPHSWNV